MKHLLRKLKAVFTLGLTWGGFGAVIGAALSLLPLLATGTTDVVGSALLYGTFGLILGVFFGLLLPLLRPGQGRPLGALRAGVVGALAGAAALVGFQVQREGLAGLRDLLLGGTGALMAVSLFGLAGVFFAAITMRFYEMPRKEREEGGLVCEDGALITHRYEVHGDVAEERWRVTGP